MPIAKAVCPDCGAKLSSPDGFEVGEEVECPKCETEFKVRAPKPATAPVKAAPKPQVIDEDDEEEERPKAKRGPEPDDDEDEDERPKKKKKKQGGKRRDDDEGGDYKNSPLRFIILGILILIMLVGGFFLVRKIMKERADNAAHHPAGASFARTASQMSAITFVAVA
jgi:DNA-directed RNA polymerase subunit RPC12/RpoP